MLKALDKALEGLSKEAKSNIKSKVKIKKLSVKKLSKIIDDQRKKI